MVNKFFPPEVGQQCIGEDTSDYSLSHTWSLPRSRPDIATSYVFHEMDVSITSPMVTQKTKQC
jgi:hypothetical protein